MEMDSNFSGSQNHTGVGKIQNNSRKTQNNSKQKKIVENTKIKLKFEKMQVKSRNFQKM